MIGLLYSNNAGTFNILLNGEFIGKNKTIVTTENYHTWNYIKNIGSITFKRSGLNFITL